LLFFRACFVTTGSISSLPLLSMYPITPEQFIPSPSSHFVLTHFFLAVRPLRGMVKE
jgi:hypothetical protein